jgi:hypothetical protein
MRIVPVANGSMGRPRSVSGARSSADLRGCDAENDHSRKELRDTRGSNRAPRRRGVYFVAYSRTYSQGGNKCGNGTSTFSPDQPRSSCCARFPTPRTQHSQARQSEGGREVKRPRLIREKGIQRYQVCVPCACSDDDPVVTGGLAVPGMVSVEMRWTCPDGR